MISKPPESGLSESGIHGKPLEKLSKRKRAALKLERGCKDIVKTFFKSSYLWNSANALSAHLTRYSQPCSSRRAMASMTCMPSALSLRAGR